MRRASGLYLAGLTLAAIAILAHSSVGLRLDHWDDILLLALPVSLGGMFSIRDLSEGDLSWIAGGVVATFIIGGPNLALWAIALGLLVDNLKRSGYMVSLVFNLAEHIVAAWISFQVFLLLGGQWGSNFRHPVEAAVLVIVFMVVNALLFGTYLHLSGRLSLGTALRSMLDSASVRTYFMVSLAGLLFAYCYVTGGIGVALLAVALAWMLQTTISHYFDAVHEARRQAQQLEVVLNATHSAILMKDDAGRVQVANHQVQVLFGLKPAELIGRQAADLPTLPQPDPAAVEGKAQVEQVLELAHGPVRYLHWYRAALHDQEGALQGHVEVYTDVSELKEAEHRARRMYDAMIRALTAAIDARDSYTRGHSERVSGYAVIIARRMGLPSRDVERIWYSALLHDIGKLGVDDAVLRKSGPLTPAERAAMMQHPTIGAEVLQKTNVLTDLIPGVRWHHEWYSGGGYPDGLAGDQIPLDARILGTADALDAMTSDRPYRAALTPQEALRRLQESSPAQFDPQVVEALLAAVAHGELVFGQPAEEPVAMGDPTVDGVIRPVHGKELLVLAQLSRVDYSALSLDAMLMRYLTTFYNTIGANVYQVFLIGTEFEQPVLGASYGLPEREASAVSDMQLVLEAMRMRAPVVVNDTRRVPCRTAAGATKAVAVFPLVSQDGVCGALAVESVAFRFFDQDAVYLFEAVAQRLCSAVKLVRYHEQLSFAAWHDGLTGVHNHGSFYERLTEAIERAERQQGAVSVVLLDLNGLKAINDTFGHLAGDAVLREYGRVLQQTVRPGDVVARYGGDEFAMIMPGLNRQGALQQVNHLVEALRGSFEHQGRTLPLPTAAWGVAAYPEDSLRPAELVMVADQHMYREKAAQTESSCHTTMSAD